MNGKESRLTRQAFLVFENLDLSTWPKVLRDSRSAYVALKEHFLPSAQQVDRLAASDPLADDIGVSVACNMGEAR